MPNRQNKLGIFRHSSKDVGRHFWRDALAKAKAGEKRIFKIACNLSSQSIAYEKSLGGRDYDLRIVRQCCCCRESLETPIHIVINSLMCVCHTSTHTSHNTCYQYIAMHHVHIARRLALCTGRHNTQVAISTRTIHKCDMWCFWILTLNEVTFQHSGVVGGGGVMGEEGWRLGWATARIAFEVHILL